MTLITIEHVLASADICVSRWDLATSQTDINSRVDEFQHLMTEA